MFWLKKDKTHKHPFWKNPLDWASKRFPLTLIATLLMVGSDSASHGFKSPTSRTDDSASCWSNLWDQLGFSERPLWKRRDFASCKLWIAGTTPCEVTQSQWMDIGEQKPGVERESCFCSSKVELIHCVSMFFWVSFIFLISFSRLCLILNKSWFFGLAEVFPYSATIAVSLPRPYKTQLPGTSTGWQRMHHTPRSRGRKKSGGKLLHTIESQLGLI